MRWDIQQVVKLTGVTSRTLRHYDAIGLLSPSGVNSSGYRFYDEEALLRLQQILLLKQFGLALSEIKPVVEGETDYASALAARAVQLDQESARIERQKLSIAKTIENLQNGNRLMPEEMFAGFDHEEYEQEVTERWGQEAFSNTAKWWGTLDEGQKMSFQHAHLDIQDAYDRLLMAGCVSSDPQVQEIAQQHYQWITQAWGGTKPSRAALQGLAEMYVADPRFSQNYNRVSPKGVEFVKDALIEFSLSLPETV